MSEDAGVTPTSSPPPTEAPTATEAPTEAPTTADGKPKSKNVHTIVHEGEFDTNNHYYPRVINASIHPMVSHFLSLGNQRIINRYCHLHPMVRPEVLTEILSYTPRFFRWAGADLFHVTTAHGVRKMVVIETNSCPSGQKSMPFIAEHEEQNGYRIMIEQTYKPIIEVRTRKEDGELAVVYDKNFMEASGYAASMADVMKEPVHLVSFYNKDCEPLVRYRDNWMEVKSGENWIRIRAAFRYVTQKPWNRLPLIVNTVILNPVVACLAGGRNKLLADKAYELYNAEIADTHLKIFTPETIRDVRKAEIPLWIERFGGHGVVKVPYSNAGQGVYTITNEHELADFMAESFDYDQFIVQSLIGNFNWSSKTTSGQFYHVGTVANKKNEIFVADLRMMVCATSQGWIPLVIYARRARKPLVSQLDLGGSSSWDMLGTNLSVKQGEEWTTETTRLFLMDRRDFNQLGLGIDDLCDAYIQTVLSAIAIDKMAGKLLDESQSHFNMELFSSMNNDPGLISEIAVNAADLEVKGQL